MNEELCSESPEEITERLSQAARVASRLSHDFGNLLTSILGFSELALTQVQPGTVVHRYITEVFDVGRDGADWLQKLNYFCRCGVPDFTPAGLSGAFAEEEARLGPAEAVRLHADIPADLPALACDADSLRQLLRQALDNAREAAGEKGVVTVTARVVDLGDSEAHMLIGNPSAGRFVEVVVADPGPGMSAELRARLWSDLFYSSKPRHRGLGLLIAYGIVHRFGGGLQIVPGRTEGTEVRVYLPAAASPVPAGPAELLVVDSDPQVLADARRVLESAGYHVSVAVSPPAALLVHQNAAQRFDLYLLAVHLPNLTGPELARRLLLRDPRAKFLFLHTPAGPALPRDGLLTPAALVHKPFAPPVLLHAVVGALKRGRQLGDGGPA
jgi:CheY-like chemotaxis protein